MTAGFCAIFSRRVSAKAKWKKIGAIKIQPVEARFAQNRVASSVAASRVNPSSNAHNARHATKNINKTLAISRWRGFRYMYIPRTILTRAPIKEGTAYQFHVKLKTEESSMDHKITKWHLRRTADTRIFRFWKTKAQSHLPPHRAFRMRELNYEPLFCLDLPQQQNQPNNLRG